jgi:electron transfer flavoprotein alpha subunit
MILVLAEHDNASVKSATLHAVTAAAKLGGDVHVLVGRPRRVGRRRRRREDRRRRQGPARRRAAPAKPTARTSPRRCSRSRHGYTHLVAPATGTGKNVMPRVAAKLDVAQVSEVTVIESPDTFVRPIYAGNAFATVQATDKVKVLTVRATAFDAAGEGGPAPVESVAAAPPAAHSATVTGQELTKSERPELVSARIVISGGRGLGNGENFRKLLEPLADRLNAALGASRAAVDAGFVPNDYQVGQTGKIVAPDLYIAVGISGRSSISPA